MRLLLAGAFCLALRVTLQLSTYVQPLHSLPQKGRGLAHLPHLSSPHTPPQLFLFSFFFPPLSRLVLTLGGFPAAAHGPGGSLGVWRHRRVARGANEGQGCLLSLGLQASGGQHADLGRPAQSLLIYFKAQIPITQTANFKFLFGAVYETDICNEHFWRAFCPHHQPGNIVGLLMSFAMGRLMKKPPPRW